MSSQSRKYVPLHLIIVLVILCKTESNVWPLKVGKNEKFMENIDGNVCARDGDLLYYYNTMHTIYRIQAVSYVHRYITFFFRSTDHRMRERHTRKKNSFLKILF